MREARLVHPRRRPAGAARVRRAVARLEEQEGRASEGDIPGEATGLGETGCLRRGGAGERQDLGRPTGRRRWLNQGRGRGDRTQMDYTNLLLKSSQKILVIKT
jgi:hypothetical protein